MADDSLQQIPPINAVRQLVRSTGETPSAAFTLTASDMEKKLQPQLRPTLEGGPPMCWKNTNVRDRDTVCILELRAIVNSLEDAEGINVRIQVVPQHLLPIQSFPTTCIVSLPTVKGSAVDDIVVKEWKFDRLAKDFALEIPLKTLLNVATMVLADGEGTCNKERELPPRLFLGLRFVGCCDTSGTHLISRVTVQYTSPHSMTAASVSGSANTKTVYHQEAKPHPRCAQLEQSQQLDSSAEIEIEVSCSPSPSSHRFIGGNTTVSRALEDDADSAPSNTPGQHTGTTPKLATYACYYDTTPSTHDPHEKESPMAGYPSHGSVGSAAGRRGISLSPDCLDAEIPQQTPQQAAATAPTPVRPTRQAPTFFSHHLQNDLEPDSVPSAADGGDVHDEEEEVIHVNLDEETPRPHQAGGVSRWKHDNSSFIEVVASPCISSAKDAAGTSGGTGTPRFGRVLRREEEGEVTGTTDGTGQRKEPTPLINSNLNSPTRGSVPPFLQDGCRQPPRSPLDTSLPVASPQPVPQPSVSSERYYREDVDLSPLSDVPHDEVVNRLVNAQRKQSRENEKGSAAGGGQPSTLRIDAFSPRTNRVSSGKNAPTPLGTPTNNSSLPLHMAEDSVLSTVSSATNQPARRKNKVSQHQFVRMEVERGTGDHGYAGSTSAAAPPVTVKREEGTDDDLFSPPPRPVHTQGPATVPVEQRKTPRAEEILLSASAPQSTAVSVSMSTARATSGSYVTGPRFEPQASACQPTQQQLQQSAPTGRFCHRDPTSAPYASGAPGSECVGGGGVPAAAAVPSKARFTAIRGVGPCAETGSCVYNSQAPVLPQGTTHKRNKGEPTQQRTLSSFLDTVPSCDGSQQLLDDVRAVLDCPAEPTAGSEPTQSTTKGAAASKVAAQRKRCAPRHYRRSSMDSRSSARTSASNSCAGSRTNSATNSASNSITEMPLEVPSAAPSTGVVSQGMQVTNTRSGSCSSVQRYPTVDARLSTERAAAAVTVPSVPPMDVQAAINSCAATVTAMNINVARSQSRSASPAVTSSTAMMSCDSSAVPPPTNTSAPGNTDHHHHRRFHLQNEENPPCPPLQQEAARVPQSGHTGQDFGGSSSFQSPIPPKRRPSPLSSGVTTHHHSNSNSNPSGTGNSGPLAPKALNRSSLSDAFKGRSSSSSSSAPGAGSPTDYSKYEVQGSAVVWCQKHHHNRIGAARRICTVLLLAGPKGDKAVAINLRSSNGVLSKLPPLATRATPTAYLPNTQGGVDQFAILARPLARVHAGLDAFKAEIASNVVLHHSDVEYPDLCIAVNTLEVVDQSDNRREVAHSLGAPLLGLEIASPREFEQLTSLFRQAGMLP